VIPLDSSPLEIQVKERLVARLGNRVRKLEVRFSEQGVELSGEAPNFHVKQIAQHSVWEVMPQARLTNAITVL
jgi:osmotically-inducible protein OsmY